MRRKATFNDVRNSVIRRMRKRGVTFRKIGEKFSISTARVYQIVENKPYPYRPCTVYIVKAGDFIKVGVTEDIERRMKTLQAGCPLAVELIHTIPHASRETESEFHRRLAEHHLWYEWFKLTPAVQQFINTLT